MICNGAVIYTIIGGLVAACTTTCMLLASDVQTIVFGKTGRAWTAIDLNKMARTEQMAAAVSSLLTDAGYRSGAPAKLRVKE